LTWCDAAFAEFYLLVDADGVDGYWKPLAGVGIVDVNHLIVFLLRGGGLLRLLRQQWNVVLKRVYKDVDLVGF
jgi:hypothetical protein